MKKVQESVKASNTVKASNKFFISDNGEKLDVVHTMDNIEEKTSTYVSVVMNAESAEKSHSIENFANLVKEKFGIPSFGFEKEMSISDAFDEILDKQSVSDWFLDEFGVEVRMHYNVGGYAMYGNTTRDGRHYVTYETFGHFGRTRTLEGLKM